ncbi:MAG: methyltransferase domain-containing protein, partial [Kiritimatiellae bacterium]|nr:methyltransferase domain-containing protein [Kiritimatiellia bacterium]
DACAAPGGKTILLAEEIQDKGRIIAVDADPERINMLSENIRRMGFGSVTVKRADASRPSELITAVGVNSFDRILLDVPCTNTGVLARRPDARWRFNARRLQELTRLQVSLLESVASLLKPGGTLVYSTCSLEREENEALVENWLASHPEFRFVRSTRLFPPESQTDGIYAAAICRQR